uniref:Uncharacterized protein n=1 Tax=Solanum lycopersicum TaxID=4081 RepID=A0A3Q7GKP2_SOLLC
MSLGQPVAVTVNCTDNTGAKNLYIISMVLVSLFPSITSQCSFEFEVTGEFGCGGIAYFS